MDNIFFSILVFDRLLRHRARSRSATCWAGSWPGSTFAAAAAATSARPTSCASLGPLPALIVLFLDAAKGWACVAFAFKMGFSDLFVAGAALAVVAGHNWSLFLKLKGGRGVATALGILVGWAPFVALALVVVFVIVVTISRYVSLGSIIVVGAAAGSPAPQRLAHGLHRGRRRPERVVHHPAHSKHSPPLGRHRKPLRRARQPPGPVDVMQAIQEIPG